MPDSSASPTLAALHLLRPSGPNSFEQLLCDLLSQLAGVPFRLATAGGPQGGADAFAPTGIAMEAKRYDATSLRERELRGELDQAADNPDLELWALCTTARLDGLKRRNLEASAARKGIALLVLDTGDWPPLPSALAVLAAVCATGAERVLEVLAQPQWLDPERTSVPDLAAVERELAGIRALPDFGAFCDTMRTTLRELPTWRRLVERQNAGLARKIQADAETYFGSPYEPARAITRTVQAEIAAWLRTALAATKPELGVLYGERYDGKTWCLFGWLLANLSTLDLPVFLVPSREGDRGVPLYDHLLAQAREALGPSHARHADGVLQRRMHTACGDTPWCLLLPEGLNEYKLHPDNCFQHLAWGLARNHPDRRACACLCTIRRQSWEDIATRVDSLAEGLLRRLRVRPYDDLELHRALALEGLPPGWFDARPAAVQELLRRPRFLRLAAQHAAGLGSDTVLSEEVLYWLDATDKIRSAQPGAPADWDEDAYQGVLQGLARRHLERQILRRADVFETLRQVTDDAGIALNQLISEGVLRREGNRYDVRADGLVVGMGLFILHRLEDAAAGGRPLREEIHDLLAPLQDTDQAAAYLRAAAVFSLLAPAGHYAAAIVDTLIAAWLGARNLSRRDVQEIHDFSPLLLEPLLRLAPETWSLVYGNAHLQEASTLMFIAALTDRRELVRTHLRQWLRTVPTRGSWVIEDRDGSEARIAAQLAEPEMARFSLVARGDSGVLRLHNLALYLETRHPGLLEPEDCLALIAAQHVAIAPASDGQWLVLRRVLGTVPVAWFEEQARACHGAVVPVGIQHQLLVAADRDDLAPPVTVPTQQELPERLRLDRERYEQSLAASPVATGNPMGLLSGARHLVIDPDLPKPTGELLARLRNAWRAHFAALRLQLDRAPTGDDHLFAATVPAIAAWAPSTGAEVVRSQILDLSRRLAGEQHWWVLDLGRHAVLAEGEVRTALRAVCETDYPDTDRCLAVGYCLLALLPTMSPAERVDAILDHHTIREWRTLFDFVEDLDDEQMAPAIQARLDGETDPQRLLRARFLLASTGEAPLSPDRVEALRRDLASADRHARLGILAVAVRYRVREMPPELLRAIATDSEDKTNAPRWSAFLLVYQGAFLDQLPVVWQAVAAVTNDALRARLLAELEAGLLGTAAPDDAPPAGATIEIVPGCDDRPTSRRLSLAAPAAGVTFIRPEATVGGLSAAAGGDTSEDLRQLFDEDAAIRRRERLQSEALEAFRRREHDLAKAWSSEEFPQPLIDGLEPHRFTSWVEALLRAAPGHVFWSWYGLLVSVFRRALREGHPHTAELWTLAQPFQRNNPFHTTQFMVGDVDWSLAELGSPQADDRTARVLLRRLIVDCRTDGELLDVALGARYGTAARVTDIALELSRDPDPETRARGARLAGWLPGGETRLQELASTDPSLWVRRVAAQALAVRTRERFAQHWFQCFLGSHGREERWGAAQLFCECIDAAASGWTWKALREQPIDVRTRGEALQLLREIEQSVKRARQELDKTFLDHEVNSLEEICRPWHRQKDWEDVA
jgi:hypothetical protein